MFNVGDRVVITNTPEEVVMGLTGTVVEISGRVYPVVVKLDNDPDPNSGWYPFDESELELVTDE